MRVSYWPHRAWSTLVGPVWPWLSPSGDADAFARRVRGAIDPYWTKRLRRIPARYLSERARETLIGARERIDIRTVSGAGYQLVERAGAGRADAFWFFELGGTAWIRALDRLRSQGWLPPVPEGSITPDEVEAAWRKGGPEAAKSVIDPVLARSPVGHATLALYRVPIALWHDRSADDAIRLLDRAVSRLTTATMGEFGVTLPLTYGLLHGLRGDVERAAEILNEAPDPQRPPGWSGLASPEVRYWRARFLWDSNQSESAVQLVRKVIECAPEYLLRLATDRAWQETNVESRAQLGAMIGEVVDSARGDLTRFQQSRKEGDEQIQAVRTISEIMRFAADEPYMLLAAASLLPEIETWRESQASVGHAFHVEYQRMRSFIDHLPANLPLRLGAGFQPRLRGEDSDIQRLDELIARKRFREAKRYLDDLYREIPLAAKMASASYGSRLVGALATAGEVLQGRGQPEDKQRLRRIYQLSQRCVDLVRPIQDLPDQVGESLLDDLQQVWGEIAAIERAWIDSESRAFGQMRLVPPSEVQPIERGGWTAYTFSVVDSAGRPVAGVPILWRIVSGPAHPKEPAECLDGEWFVSLKTGRVYLTVEVRGAGGGGEIEARILGDYSPVRIRYSITD